MRYSSSVPSEVEPGSIMTCSRCSHKWAIRKKGALPKNCPKCRSTLWMKNYHVYTCMKCEHSWGTANEAPLRCPKCHTSKWNSPSTPRAVEFEPIKCKLSDGDKKRIYHAYDGGKSCITISIMYGISFGDVMDALLERVPGETIRI